MLDQTIFCLLTLLTTRPQTFTQIHIFRGIIKKGRVLAGRLSAVKYYRKQYTVYVVRIFSYYVRSAILTDLTFMRNLDVPFALSIKQKSSAL